MHPSDRSNLPPAISAEPDIGPLIAQGLSARLHAWGEADVLKLYHASVSNEMIEREAAAAALADRLGLPTAAPLGRWPHDGQRGLIFRRLRGASLLSVLRGMPWQAGRWLAAMSRLQRTIHGHRAPDMRALKTVLRTDILYGPAPAALQAAGCAYLATLPDGQALLHGDYHPGNLMCVGDDLHVIDWAKCARGAPPADLVRTEMLMRFGEGASDPLTSLWRDWAARRLVRTYLRGGSVTKAELAAWRPVVALAWLRARGTVRQAAFLRYLNRALRDIGLPAYRP